MEKMSTDSNVYDLITTSQIQNIWQPVKRLFIIRERLIINNRYIERFREPSLLMNNVRNKRHSCTVKEYKQKK